MSETETNSVVNFPGTIVQSDTSSSTSSAVDRSTDTENIQTILNKIENSGSGGNSGSTSESKLLWAAIGTTFGLLVALAGAMFLESKSLNQSINDTKFMVSDSNTELKDSFHEFERRLWDRLDEDKEAIRANINQQKSDILNIKNDLNSLEKNLNNSSNESAP